MRRLGRILAGASQAMLAGAFFFLASARLLEAQPGERARALLFGAVYGLAVLALLRLFRVAPWGYWIAGLFAGPVPFALAVDRLPADERAGTWILTALLGVCIGGLEAARLSRERRDATRA